MKLTSTRARSNMKLNPQDLEKITDLTLDHYNECAEDSWEGTRDHDVNQNIAALLQCIEREPPFAILNFGCGPSRDLKVFSELGHIAVGLEGAVPFAAMARAHSGCEVWQQDFLKLDLPDDHFDGVFANAALFHVPSQELPRVLLELHKSLKPDGVLFSSNPRGHNEEGWRGGRYGVFHDLETWRRYLSAAGFMELNHYYRPAGLPHERQPWLASVWRRKDPQLCKSGGKP
jgi:SAM-dependent methyltransferase